MGHLKEKNIHISDYQLQITSTLDSDYWFSGDEIQFILQKAIATLPQKQQLVFNMKYFDEMKYEEIDANYFRFHGFASPTKYC